MLPESVVPVLTAIVTMGVPEEIITSYSFLYTPQPEKVCVDKAIIFKVSPAAMPLSSMAANSFFSPDFADVRVATAVFEEALAALIASLKPITAAISSAAPSHCHFSFI